MNQTLEAQKPREPCAFRDLLRAPRVVGQIVSDSGCRSAGCRVDQAVRDEEASTVASIPDAPDGVRGALCPLREDHVCKLVANRLVELTDVLNDVEVSVLL